MQDMLILSGARTAIGNFGGALKGVAAAELGAIVLREAIARARMRPADVEHVVLGNVIPSTPQDAYIARVAAVRAGVPVGALALTVNRLCGSGLQAVISATQMIALGECEVALGGGAESMSNAPHYVTRARFGRKMGDVAMIDALTRTLSDPLDDNHMGVTAENVARRCGIGREHPVGATGVINLVKCLYELRRSGGTLGLVTMCIGGGQGIAMVVENLSNN